MASEKVLVTGASGFVAAHIIKQLIELGYNVVGTVRSPPKGQFYEEQYGKDRFQYEIVPDISVLHAFDNVFKAHQDILYVLHTASPFTFKVNDPEKDLIIPAVNGTLSALKGAHKYGEKVKKMVITSSYAAMAQNPSRLNDPSMVYSSSVWNPVTMEQGKSNPQLGYVASKTFAEKAAWEFLETEKPKFKITTIQVPMVFGPPINDIGIKNLNTSTQVLYDLIKSDRTKSEQLPSILPIYIDVRDCARAHVRAMTATGLDNKRSFNLAGPADAQRFVDVIRKVKPEYDSVLPLGNPGSFSFDKFAQFDISESQKYLKIDYIPIEKTVIDTVDRIHELEAAKI